MSQSETRILIALMSIGFCLNFILGIVGSFYPPDSYLQMTLWQVGDSMAIMASVLAGRYIGSRGQNISAAGYTLFGIAYGVSFSSSAINALNEEKMATIILPLVPALFLISFCKIYPLWLKGGSLLVCVPFFFMYKNVISGIYSDSDISNSLAYLGIQILGVLWTIFIYRDFKKQLTKE